MSDSRATDQSRRLNHQGTFARTAANVAVSNSATRNRTAVSIWTMLWTWLAAVAAIAVILGVVFGYGRSDLERPSGDPAAAGQATGSTPSASLSTPRSDERAPGRAAPADHQ